MIFHFLLFFLFFIKKKKFHTFYLIFKIVNAKCHSCFHGYDLINLNRWSGLKDLTTRINYKFYLTNGNVYYIFLNFVKLIEMLVSFVRNF